MREDGGSETVLESKGRKRDDGDGDSSKSLQYVSFGQGDDDSYILKLEWRTRYACDNYKRDNDEKAAGGHWGFFTWLIIM